MKILPITWGLIAYCITKPIAKALNKIPQKIAKNIAVGIIVAAIFFVIVLGIPLVISGMYMIGADNHEANTMYSATDILVFYGGILSFIGTSTLGITTYMQTKKANEVSLNLYNDTRNAQLPSFEVIDKDCKIYDKGAPWKKHEIKDYDALFSLCDKSGGVMYGDFVLSIKNQTRELVRNISIYKAQCQSLGRVDFRKFRCILSCCKNGTRLNIDEKAEKTVRVMLVMADPSKAVPQKNLQTTLYCECYTMQNNRVEFTISLGVINGDVRVWSTSMPRYSKERII